MLSVGILISSLVISHFGTPQPRLGFLLSLASNNLRLVIVSSMMRGRLWKIGDRIFDLSRQGLIMGVLNVTPDSFSDGGEFFAADAAIAGGIKMALEGADIIDVGGESTRPGAEPVSVKEELQRVVPVIEKLRAKINISISIDTSKPEVASTALDAGASIINDVSAGRGDEKMLSLAARRKAAIVLMHMRGEPLTMQKNPHYEDVVTEIGRAHV